MMRAQSRQRNSIRVTICGCAVLAVAPSAGALPPSGSGLGSGQDLFRDTACQQEPQSKSELPAAPVVMTRSVERTRNRSAAAVISTALSLENSSSVKGSGFVGA